MDATDNRKPFKVKDITRNITKEVEAGTLEEIRSKIAEKFEKPGEQAAVHLDSDGTEIDDEEYFRFLDEETELIAVFPGEHWIDPHRVEYAGLDSTNDTTDAATKAENLKYFLEKIKAQMVDISDLTESEIESLTNMDPNSVVDITGIKEQLKEPGSWNIAMQAARDQIDLLGLLEDGICSKNYPEAELLTKKILKFQMKSRSTKKPTKTTTTETGITNEEQQKQQIETETINEQEINNTESELSNENSNLEITTTSSKNINDNTNNEGSSNNNDI